ncbi:MAG: helix-turn-helix domain-containing protein [Chloroflexota bacterium]
MDVRDPTLVAREPLVIRVDTAAQLLDVSRPTVYRLLADGQLPFVMVGADRRIPLAALREWISQRMEREVASCK